MGPFRGPIAHGYLTLSLVIPLFNDLLSLDGLSRSINYGLDKARFPGTVKAGAKIRRMASSTPWRTSRATASRCVSPSRSRWPASWSWSGVRADGSKELVALKTATANPPSPGPT
jgi:acyl dehydratase